MRKILNIILLLLLCILPATSFAADLFFTSDGNTFAQNQSFLVDVYVDTKDVSVNALEGSVVFPSVLLDLTEIRDGNSSINFWIEKPHVVKASQISFSGITTGGFSGSKVFIFSLVFKSKIAGKNTINFKDIKILQNDGLGTKVASKVVPFTFSISRNIAVSNEDSLNIEDINKPEDFNPFIGKDQNMFDNKYFLVWSTTDKGVGIDHYEVKEGFWGKFAIAESPYVLTDQDLTQNIYVKAVDKKGNEKIAEVKAQNVPLVLELGLIFVIIIITCIFLFKRKFFRFLQ